MQTTPHRPSRARKPAATPFSPAAARLIQQIKAEAIEELLQDLSAGDSITVLHGFDANTKRVVADGNSIDISDLKGNSAHFYRRHLEEECWRSTASMIGYWHGWQTLVDANGVEWEHRFKPHVCDDFGNLVQVPA